MYLKLESPDIWNNLTQVKMINKKIASLKFSINTIDQIYKNLKDLKDLLELIKECDVILLSEVYDQLISIKHTFTKLELTRMFVEKYDSFNCYIDIQSGSGGVEAQDWARMLLRMYLRWFEHKGFTSSVVEESVGEVSGIKAVTVQVFGEYAYGWLRTESGIHRLVRKSPFDSSGKRHTSFASVSVYPALDDNINICIKSEDLRYDYYKSSGAGGQHVNCTESAVRITHIPTNIVTQCQSERSQHKNKHQALKQLKLKLYRFELDKKNSEKKIQEEQKLDIAWGNQIRSYILDCSRIKDLRSGMETRDVKSFLDGDLDHFVIKNIKQCFQ